MALCAVVQGVRAAKDACNIAPNGYMAALIREMNGIPVGKTAVIVSVKHTDLKTGRKTESVVDLKIIHSSFGSHGYFFSPFYLQRNYNSGKVRGTFIFPKAEEKKMTKTYIVKEWEKYTSSPQYRLDLHAIGDREDNPNGILYALRQVDVDRARLAQRQKELVALG